MIIDKTIQNKLIALEIYVVQREEKIPAKDVCDDLDFRLRLIEYFNKI